MANETKPVDNHYQQSITTKDTHAEDNKRVYSPMTDIIETDDEILMIADMPGVDDKSIDITLDKNVLTISGDVQEPRFENYKLTYAESRANRFSRSFALPEQINHEKILATVKNGVLRLHLPISTENQTHKITVKSI